MADDETSADLASRSAGASALEALAKGSAKPQVLMIYGRGADLGDFSVFANSLKRELAPKYGGEIDIQNVERKAALFALLKKPRLPGFIRELHIFSHSMGAGLFLGYHDPTLQIARTLAVTMAERASRKVKFEEVLSTEAGALLTDDLLTTTAQADKAAIRANLAVGATAKIWGCNSGVQNWVYSDNAVSDPANTSQSYYWRALNEKNTPKPSIAQALADYLGLQVMGAHSGSHIEVNSKGKWINSDKFKKEVGHWPSPQLPTKLVPDSGDFDPCTPRP